MRFHWKDVHLMSYFSPDVRVYLHVEECYRALMTGAVIQVNYDELDLNRKRPVYK